MENERRNPVIDLNITDPLEFSRELCDIFINHKTEYMYYGIREYLKWMTGKYFDWFINYENSDYDLFPGVAMSLSAFYYPIDEDEAYLKAATLAFKYMAKHYQKTHNLTDLYCFYYLMFRTPYANLLTEDKDEQNRLQMCCLLKNYDYQNNCYSNDEDIILFCLGNIKRDRLFYQKYASVYNAEIMFKGPFDLEDLLTPTF